MIAVSTLLMFGLMYLNTYEIDHVFLSETRAYMALIMGASMAVVMLLFMKDMYANRKMNAIIQGSSAVIFLLALGLVRSQATVGDVSWMKAMIPHHSIAILTSNRAHLSDPRVQQLAKSISDTQVREIGEMKELIRSLENK